MGTTSRRVGAAAVVALAGLLAALIAPTAASATTDRNLDRVDRAPVVATAPAVQLVPFVSNLSQPVFITGAHDGTPRLFIVEKTGRIRIRKSGVLLARAFLDVHTSISQGSEQGLLGLAFSPQYTTDHRFYVDYTDLNGNTVIREYRQSTANPDVTLAGSGRTILTISQPYSNHNGGMLAFGRDGYLYIGMGDGGSGGDPGNRAQNLGSLLGKLLRIDPLHTSSGRPYAIPSTNPYVGRTGLDQIWDYGLRNPWRFSFDKATGNLWIGDVGQDSWEEVDRASYSTTSRAGRGFNWGWHVMEGRSCYDPPTGCNTSGKVLPPVVYDHSNGRCAITGGYVYRGSAIPGLVGAYVFGDYCSGEIWYTTATSTAVAAKTLLIDTPYSISSFGQDGNGELYVCDLGGAIYKLVPG